METRKNITLNELEGGIQSYEETVLKAFKESKVSETPLIYRYKGVRRSKLVAVELDGLSNEKISNIREVSLKFIDSDVSITENVELFTLGVVSDSQRVYFNSLYQEVGLSLNIVDGIQMTNIKEFDGLFKDTITEEVDADTSLYEYLSMSNDTADAKNSLFYALLIMAIYQNQPVKKSILDHLMTEKYGDNVGNINLALKTLRKEGKIAFPGKGDTINLTEDEKIRLERSLKEEKAIEYDFRTRFEEILDKFGVKNGEQILDRLREAYQAQYQWRSRPDDDEHRKEDLSREYFDKIKAAIEKQVEGCTESFLNELKTLCDNSDYLNRYGLSRSFLQLYRTPEYEQYINNKESIVYLDTPVLTNYLCYLSGMENKYDFSWSDSDYQNVKSLISIKESEQDDIVFAAPYDYLQETAGELKKALQFSWFDNIDLPIPFETGNTFFNFYLAVKNARSEIEGKQCRMSFLDFASMLGFEELNPNASLFLKKAYTHLKYFFEKFGCNVIDPIQDHYDSFDSVRDQYITLLQSRIRKKTVMAINSDIRQAFFIANDYLNDEFKECDFFLSTWDKTLKILRDIVNGELSLVSSYSVMSPANLANRLALRHFKINKTSVSNDVFAYAESGFNFTTKVQSLYDNILTPYFANANNQNATLVVTMLKMEKDCHDAEIKDEGRIKENTVLADIFLPIINALPDYDLSPQNLREFLANQENNDFIISLFQEAFEANLKGGTLDISERFCQHIKIGLNNDDEAIKL